jgi:lipopolysaccharide/colanic/teichoic acid biosynthesis glycosyltransferase
LLLLILDHRPAYLRSARAEVSLLMLPLGTGSLLDHVTEQLAAVSGLRSGKLVIVPTFRPDRDYKRRVRTRVSSGVNVMGPGGLARALGACEPADYVLLVDPLRWPVTGSDLAAAVERHRDYQSANHMIAVGADPEGTRERVEYDRRGRVARVQRLFNRVNWPEVAATCIFLSIAPALAIRGVRFRSLGELRSALCGKGVLSRDVPLPLDLVDLSTAEGVLALNEKLLPQVTRDGSRPGFVARGEGVLVGRGCHIDPSSRFVGPVIVQERAIIEARAPIVGPTGSASATDPKAPAVLPLSLGPGDDPGRARPTAKPVMPAAHWGKSIHLAAKRALDSVFSLAALLVLSPFLLAVAIVIKLDSRGPVLFTHRREQKGGKEFACLKFRTMVAGAHEQQRELYEQNLVDGPQFKLRRDPRITRVGRWLRGTNIDELPQLINVLFGQMSLVGPRPSPFRENQICVPWRRARLSVRPGITGLWQLCRSEDRSAGDFHQWIFYDIAYVRHLSIWLDLKILLATVLTLAGRWRVPLSWLVRDGRAGTSYTRVSTEALPLS